MKENERFWRELDDLVTSTAVEIDRPRCTPHPRFPEFVYPVNYGYLLNTVGGDGEGIDVWIGEGAPSIVGIFATFDPFKRNAELKLVVGCSSDEIARIEEFYAGQPQVALLVLRPGDRP